MPKTISVEKDTLQELCEQERNLGERYSELALEIKQAKENVKAKESERARCRTELVRARNTIERLQKELA